MINKKMIARQNNNLVSLGVTVQQALVIAYLDKSKDKKSYTKNDRNWTK